jgi:APA family basic amino acid/polyamine antiporter
MTHSGPTEHRALGFWMSTALVIGNTIGMGIFILPASLAPYGFNAIAGWVLTLVGFLFIARVLAGLASAFPQDEGPYAYTERALGEPTAFMVMWCYWVATWVTNATIAVGVVGYLSILVPAINSNKLFLPLIALSLVWLFVLLNLRGVRTVGGAQVLTTALKLLPMVAVVVLGLWQLITGPSAYVAHPPTTPLSAGAIITASTTAIFAMLGVECATIPAGRVKDPGRTIPLATMAGTTLTALIYIAISVVPMLLIPQAELAASNAPFADLFGRFLGGGSAQLLAVFVIISGLGALNGWTLVVGEVTMNFAKHGSFPRGLAKVNSKDAPTRAFVLTGVVASLMLLANYNATLVESFTRLSNVVSAANLPLYITCAMAVLVAWRRGQLNVSGGRATVLLVAAAMAIAFCLFAFRGFAPKDLLWALGFAAVGAVVYLFALLNRRRGASIPSRAT